MVCDDYLLYNLAERMPFGSPFLVLPNQQFVATTNYSSTLCALSMIVCYRLQYQAVLYPCCELDMENNTSYRYRSHVTILSSQYGNGPRFQMSIKLPSVCPQASAFAAMSDSESSSDGEAPSVKKTPVASAKVGFSSSKSIRGNRTNRNGCLQFGKYYYNWMSSICFLHPVEVRALFLVGFELGITIFSPWRVLSDEIQNPLMF